MEPFTIEMEALAARKVSGTEIDTRPGTELIKVFGLLDKSSTPRSKGAVVCMKPALGAIDRDNYIVPIWMN